MAKIRIEQIKDLALTPSAQGTTRSLTIGAGNSITPLAEVAVAEVENSVITGLTQSGNNLTATRKTFADIVASGLTVNGTGTGVVTSLSFENSTITANFTSNASSKDAADLTVLAGYEQDAAGKITSVATKTFGADFKEENGIISLAKSFIETSAITTTISETASDEKLPTEKAVKTYVDGKVADAIEATTYTQGNGIAISDENVISAVVNANDKVLSVDANGISSTLDLKYDSTAKEIRLFGKSTVTPIATIDATDFIKDGMLSSATIVKGKWSEDGKQFTETEGGLDSAIKLEWNTDAGKEAMYINSESLVDAYLAGNDGIVIDKNTNTISHKPGALDANTVKGSVGNVVEGTEYVFSVPTVKVDEFGHVIELSDKSVTINVASTITDEASKKVATEGAVKSYVDEQVSAVKVPFHITEKITADTDKQTTLILQKAPYNNQAVVYQNGLCVIGEYKVEGTTITLTLEVPAQVGDVFTVDYEA